MLLPSSAGVRSTLSFLLVAVVYWLSFWRTFKEHRGNKVVECGSITLMLGFLLMLLMKIPNVPAWVSPSLGLLIFLLCLFTMFFLLVRGVNAIRQRKSKTVEQPSAVADALYGVDYQPRNAKEKWLLRIAYWGTTLLVAFLFWEYVKAK